MTSSNAYSDLDQRASDEQSASDDGLRLLSLEEFIVRPSLRWHVRGVAPAGAIIVVFGAPKSGKTFAVCDLTMHAAHGMNWRGHVVSRRVRVAFLAGEARNGLRVRLKAWLAEHGPTTPGSFKIMPAALSLPQRVGEVIDLLRAYRPDVVVLDTLNAYFGGGDENSTQDMSAFVAASRYLREELDCTLIIVHHTGVANQTRERGSGVLRAAADVIVQVARDEDGSGLVAFQVIDGRDIEAWDNPLALRLRAVDTDWRDDDGDVMRTCVVESAGQPVTLPGRGGPPLGAKQRELIAVVQELAQRKTGGAAGTALLMRADVSKAAQDRGIAKQTVSEAMRSLAQRGHWRLVEPGSLSFEVRP